MTREYRSFLVRYWRLSDDARRVEVQHIQSGSHVRVGSLAAAIEWISAQCGDGAEPQPALQDLAEQTTDDLIDTGGG